MLARLKPSVGSVGDAIDKALAETTIGLYKTKAVRADSPFRRGPLHRLADVDLLTATGSAGTTPAASCTASAAHPLWSSRRPTTLKGRPPRRAAHQSVHQIRGGSLQPDPNGPPPF